MIIQPESNGTIPEKEQIALQNVRQEILIGEQKVRQLQGAVRQLNSEIQDALRTKDEVAGSLETLKENKKFLEGQIETLTQEKESLVEDNKQAQNLFVKVSRETDEKHQALSLREESCRTNEQRLIENQKDHQAKVEDLNQAIQKHQERVGRLIEALK